MLVVERHAAHVFTTLCMVSLDPGPRRARRSGSPATRRRCCSPDGRGRAARARRRPARRSASLEDAGWPAYEIALPDAWSLLLYTDGVTDGRVGDGRARLGEDGLAEVVAAAQAGADAEPDELVRLVVERAEDLNGGPLADDVALVLVARRRP